MSRFCLLSFINYIYQELYGHSIYHSIKVPQWTILLSYTKLLVSQKYYVYSITYGMFISSSEFIIAHMILPEKLSVLHIYDYMEIFNLEKFRLFSTIMHVTVLHPTLLLVVTLICMYTCIDDYIVGY